MTPPALTSAAVTPTGARARAGAVLLAASLLLAVATVVLDVLNRAVQQPLVEGRGWPSALAGLALAVPGCLLLRRCVPPALAWVMAVGGLLWCVDALASGWATYALQTEPGTPGASVAYFVFLRVGSVLMLPLPLLLLLFPDGRLPTGRLRLPAVLTLAGTALLPIALVLVPSAAATRYHDEPLPDAVRDLALDPFSVALPYPVWHAVLTVAFFAMTTSLVVPVLTVLGRLRRASAEQRAQLSWLLLAGVLGAAVLLLGSLLPGAVAQALLPVSVALVSGAVVVAVTRYRLYDVDLLLGWTLLYGALAAFVVVLDVALFTLAGSVLDSRGSALLATAVVAVLYGPLRVRLHTLVQRVVRGSRDDPYAVVSALARRLEDSTDPDAQLVAVARSVAAAFRSRYVRVELERDTGELVVAEHGTRGQRTVDLPVTYRGAHIGRLVLAPASGTHLSDDDQQLLADVVRQAAAAHRSALLAEQLQDSRQALVTAREEERRRLRRDLHDGLGPTLAAISLRIEAARNLARRSPEEADEVLAATVADVGGVLADVRRLVHDLLPPALDEVGLVGALRQQAERLRRTGDGTVQAPLDVRLEAVGHLGELPAAVEVAAYRIVSEALTNVVRHSGARCATVRLHVRDGLHVEVSDDGDGIPADAPAGVGLASLRERASELGGEVSVSCPDEGGTVVHARLPLPVGIPEQPGPVHPVRA